MNTRRKLVYILLVCLVVTILSSLVVLSISLSAIRDGMDEFAHWSGGNRKVHVKTNGLNEAAIPANWKFHIPTYYDGAVLRAWSPSQRSYPADLVAGTGENGTAFSQIPLADPRVQQLMKEYGYNMLATERMSLQRTLPDYRCGECRRQGYPAELPAASIILAFHNEPWSLICRSVQSIIDRSPHELIEEIILVDDASTWTVLNRPLADYVEMLPVPVKLVRTQTRAGSIRARLIGAREAKGSVLVFLSAQVEVTDGWLQPLLTTIATDRSAIASPHVNWIDPWDFSYSSIPMETKGYIGLDATLNFTWTAIPEREKLRTNGDKTAPLRVPTLIGCAMAVDRYFFYEIGAFDANMEVRGGENLEIALRAWQCGGSVLLVPCSHVGNLFRIVGGNRSSIEHRDNVGALETSTDEYKQLNYSIVPEEAKKILPSDFTDRQNVRSRLKCKSFSWFLEHIYPESATFTQSQYEVIGEFKIGFQIVNQQTVNCMDLNAWPHITTENCTLEGKEQSFAFTDYEHGQIRTFLGAFCVGLGDQHHSITIRKCNLSDDTQLWSYHDDTKLIRNKKTGMCMRNNVQSHCIEMGACDRNSPAYQWILILGAFA